jgi:hypothetical protein
MSGRQALPPLVVAAALALGWQQKPLPIGRSMHR